MSKVQNNSFDISGKVLHVGQPERISEKFSKRELVMEVFAGRYGQERIFEFINENMSQISNMKEGDWVTIQFQLKGKKVTKDGKTRWYNADEGIQCFKE